MAWGRWSSGADRRRDSGRCAFTVRRYDENPARFVVTGQAGALLNIAYTTKRVYGGGAAIYSGGAGSGQAESGAAQLHEPRELYELTRPKVVKIGRGERLISESGIGGTLLVGVVVYGENSA